MKRLFILFFILSFYSPLWSQATSELLTFPIELKYFKAEKKAQTIVLNWLAPCQVSEATFDIQHSTDSRNFTTLYSITADQVRCTQPFEFTDLIQRNGTHFYRIKMTAVTNQSLHSFTVSVLNGSTGFAINALLPSVVQHSTRLNVSSASNDQLQLTVHDVSGRQYLTRSIQVQPGSNQVNLDLSFLSSGTFILSAVNSKRQTESIRFIRQ